MDRSEPLIAKWQMMKIMEPGVRTIDYTSILSHSTAMLSAALCQNRFKTSFVQSPAGVVSGGVKARIDGGKG
jgi:hypothetical protein